MKRALSLIIVLAMVLCMIPFSAFAEEVEAGWNTGSNFVDGTVTLNADNDYTASYLWQCGETGTMSLAYILPEGVEIEEGVIWFDVIDNQSTEVLDGAEFGVTEGEWYEIVVNSDNIPVTDLYVYSTFKGQPGTQTNPYVIKNPAVAEEGEEVVTSVEVAGNSTLVYCNLVGFAGETVIVEGTGVKVTIGDNSYGSITEDAEDNLILENTAEFDIPAGNPSVEIKLINKSAETATYTFSTKAPVIGTMDNPEVVESGEYQANLTAGNQGYYYTYFAEGDGTVTVNVYAQDGEGNTLGTTLAVNNLTSYVYGDQTNEGTWSVDVATGDEISIMVSTFNEADPWNNPAGTVTTVITFSETEPEPEVGIDWGSVLDGVTSHSNDTDAEVFYTYTVEQDGMMYRSDYGFNFFVSAGDPVNIYIAPGETVELYYASPVAKIGDAEYYSFDEAVASAVAGDTIVLLADVVSEWDGISLKPGINLNLGEYTLTAPYVIAFGEVTGVVGSASIVAENVMLNNVTIDGVEYAWTAGEGAYTLVEYEAPVVEDEEPIVAQYNGNNYSLSEALSLAAVAGTANDPAMVKLIADADMAGKTVTVPVGVALDVNGYDLTAEYLYVLNGGYITAYQNGRYSGDINSCSNINVARANLISSNSKCLNAYNSSMYVIPVWIDNCYVMANTRIAEESGKTAYVLDTEEHTVSYKFRYNGHQSLYNILKDSSNASDHAFKLCLNATWTTPTGDINLNFWVSDDFISSIASSTGTYCTFELSGLDSLEIDYSTFEVQAMVITDCGVSVFGPKY